MEASRLKSDAARFWCSALFSVAETMAKETSWNDATETCIGVVRKKLKEEAKKIVETQKIKGTDASATKRVFETLTQSPLAGWKIEDAGSTKDRTILHQVGDCPMWEACKELAIQDNLLPFRICETGCTGAVQAINPDLIVIIEKAICKNDKYCEFAIEAIKPVSLLY